LQETEHVLEPVIAQALDTQRRCQRPKERSGIADHAQVQKNEIAIKVGSQPVGDRDRDRRLADPADATYRQETLRIDLVHQRLDGLVSSDHSRQRRREGSHGKSGR